MILLKMPVGKRVKELRLKKDWTLADLAKHSRIALSTLSRIETGKMTGTLESHIQIAKTLGVRLPELYSDLASGESTLQVHPAEKNANQYLSGKGTGFTPLTAGALQQKKMLPVVVGIDSKKSTPQERGPEGSERFLYVLKGKLELQAGEETAKLNTGDSIYFQANQPHTLKNPATGAALVLSVISPAAV